MKTVLPNWVWTDQFLDHDSLMAWKQWASPELENQVLATLKQENIAPVEGVFTVSEPTRYATVWNLLSIQHPLLDVLRLSIRRSLDYFSTEPHHIRLWLNVIRDQGELPWHSHNTIEPGGLFGYVSITSEPSQTIFQLVNIADAVTIDNRDGFGAWSINTKDGGINVHKTTAMPGPGPRLSLAWDVTLSSNPRVKEDPVWMPL